MKKMRDATAGDMIEINAARGHFVRVPGFPAPGTRTQSPLRAAISIMSLVSALAVPARADFRDEPAVKELYAKAKAEGQVMIWGPSRGEVEWVPAAFAKAFPGVEVKFVGDNDVMTKAIAEARAGRNEVDVMWNSITATVPMMQRDLGVAIDWKSFGLAPEATGFEGRMGYSNKVAYAVAFMADKAIPEDAPKFWEDALADKYRGKMVASLFLLPRLAGALSLAWGEQRATQFARDLVTKADLMLTKAPRESFIESGERLFALGEIDTGFRRQIREGKKFGLALPEPVVLAQFGASVFGKAPHPAAARLLAGWLVTPEGRSARGAATGNLDYEKGTRDPFAQKLLSGEIKAVFDLPSNMAAREEAIRKIGPIVAGQAR